MRIKKSHIYIFIISFLLFLTYLFMRNYQVNDYSDYVSNGMNYCFLHDVNIDSNDDGEADTNLDTDGDGCPDMNIDAGDGLIINWDTDDDGVPDTNIDKNFDLIPDENLESDKGKSDTYFDQTTQTDDYDHMRVYPEGFENKVSDMFDNLPPIEIMIDPSHLPLDDNEMLEEISEQIKNNVQGYGIDKIADSLADVGMSCDLDYMCKGSENGGKWKFEMDLNTLIFRADYYGNLDNLLFSQYIDFNTGRGVAVNYTEYFYAVSNSKEMTYDVYHGSEEGVYEIDDRDDLLWQNHEAIMNKLYFLRDE